jgi:hypothetical protein
LATFGNRFNTDLAHPADEGLPVVSRNVRRRDRASVRPLTEVAASYARFSSDQQDVSSLEQQQRRCRDKAIDNGHDLKSELEFTDEAMSGTLIDRPGFKRMMAQAREGAFQVLYVDSLSRLSREVSFSITNLKELADVLKVRVISVSEGFDTAVPGWELNAVIRSWQHCSAGKRAPSAMASRSATGPSATRPSPHKAEKARGSPGLATGSRAAGW